MVRCWAVEHLKREVSWRVSWGQIVDSRVLKGLKDSGSVTEQQEANSELNHSDIISFSSLKKEHGGDGLNPCKEKIQRKRRVRLSAACL